MKQIFRKNSLFFLVAIMIALVNHLSHAQPVVYNQFNLGGENYVIWEGEISYHGNWFSNNAVNIDLVLYSDFDSPSYFQITFELNVPNGNESLVAGTYGPTTSDDPPAFTYVSGYVYIENDPGWQMGSEVIDGTLVVTVTGSGSNAVYTIVVNCLLDSFFGPITLQGTYRGPLYSDLDY
ncbi:MAG: hypothetical protein FWH12_07315 [Treponema sp.]|nr:hypothetical protein [Treponema sp.]